MDDAILGIVTKNVNDSDLILEQRKRKAPTEAGADVSRAVAFFWVVVQVDLFPSPERMSS